ncbi:MAG: galactose mutarotase, partial [Lachnospiraceae bacterium]|nr:galactose mutarotase [Lachnospiraceae bacterium]
LCNRIWQVTKEEADSITFSYDSPDGDMGFGGNMHIDVTYTVRDGAMVVDYHAKADEDTIFNPTNHSYFNLKGHGEGDVLDHSLIVYADEMTFADEESVPDGTIRKVSGTPFDFTGEKRIGDEIDADYDMMNFGHGYDHNFVLRGDTDEVAKAYTRTKPDFGKDGKSGTLQRAATLFAPDHSLSVCVYTDLPGVQVYTGNFIEDGSKGKDGRTYCRRGGVAIETQYYPNAMNIPSFPQPVIRANEDFYSRTVYKIDAPTA